MGIAWVSGDGGTRGYWTDGHAPRPAHRADARGDAAGPDPVRGRRLRRRARPPTPTAASSTTPSGRSARTRRAAYRNGKYLLATEEDFADPSSAAASRATSTSPRSRAATTARRGARRPSTSSGSRRSARGRRTSRRARARSAARTRRAPTSARRTTSTCDGSTVAYAWYGEGTRFLDISDPTAPEADRLLAAGRHARLGVVLPRRLRLHRGPRARHRRAAADVRRASWRAAPSARSWRSRCRRSSAASWPGWPGSTARIPPRAGSAC